MTDPSYLDVLVVDDSDTTRMHLDALLKTGNCRVKEAENGRQALEVLETFKPDLIITDFAMPEMDGLEFLSRLQGDSELLAIPVLVVTAKKMNEDTRMEIERAPNVKRVLSKPLNFPLLTEFLRAIAKKCNKQFDVPT